MYSNGCICIHMQPHTVTCRHREVVRPWLGANLYIVSQHTTDPLAHYVVAISSN